MRIYRSIITLLIVLAMVASAVVASTAAASAAGLSVAGATPSGSDASRTAQIDVTFSEAIVPASFAGTINGAAMVRTQIVVSDATHVRVDPGELAYGATYDVVVARTVQAVGGSTLGNDYSFAFTVQANPASKRPTSSLVVPSGPFTAGQSYTISGQATGSIWQRDANNPLELRHWDHNGNDVGNSPMLHPSALYFPSGIDGYKFYLYYTPYPGAEDPVVMRSNDGVHFDAVGVTNPIVTYGMQPPFDMQNLADPEAIKVGNTWMLFYEMETPASTASSIGAFMAGGGYIGLALSTDGISWTPYGGTYTYDPANPPASMPANGNPIVAPDAAYDFENDPSAKTGEPAVVFKDGLYHMWRTVLHNGDVLVVHDTANDPRGPWTKHGIAVDFGAYNYGPHVDVVYDAQRDIWTMLYLDPAGADMATLGTYNAPSPDGPWTANPANPTFQANGGWEGSTLYRSSMVLVDGQWYMYYSGEVGGQIGLAREVPGVRRVQVSTDDGATWHATTVAADGTWAYSFTPTHNGTFKIRARVADDFMLGDATASTTVSVGGGALQPAAQPILLITDKLNTANPFNGYLAEILRAEGVVEFQQIELDALTSSADPAAYLAAFDEVVLADGNLDTTAQQQMRDYVNAGGHLLAMRPEASLADLFGLTYVNARPEQLLEFFGIDTTQGPGAGITATSLQYHGDADNYTLNGATALASLYDSINTASTRPATSIANAGSGRAAAFTFDLAKSIVLTRQGNPAWVGEERDGLSSYRPSDLFAGPVGSSYLAPERTRIPQADEAQRFFANVVLSMLDTPAPRMWYLPGTHTSVIVNTGDGEDDGESALAPVINDANSYGGAFTTYMRESGIQNTSVATEAAWRAAGNEQGVHVYGDRTLDGMTAAEAAIVAQFEAKFGHSARTARNHTIAWTGWADMAAIEAANGVELDTNYYHYMNWLLGYGDNANGYFTGSGLPQKFTDEQGNVLPIYQALTEWPDEWFADNGFSAQATFNIMKSMIESADSGYYSAFVANIHAVRYNGVDAITHAWANMLWAYARDHDIPMWSAEHLADFVEARDASQFRNVAWNGTNLTFDFSTTKAGQELTIMVPAEQGSSQLLSVTVGGTPATFTEKTVAGRKYAMVTTTAASAQVVAAYGLDTTAPLVAAVTATGVTDTAATITWTTNEAADSTVDYGTTAAYGTTHSTPSLVTSHSVTLTGLTPKTAYHFQVRSADGAANATTSDDATFTTGAPRWIETTAADFADGNLTDTVVQQQGAVALGTTGTFSDQFDGTALDTAAWTPGGWAGAPAVTVADGQVTITGASYIKSQATYTRQTLSARVTLNDGSNAHFGFATALNAGDDGVTDPHWIIFTAKNGQLLARTRMSDGLGIDGGQIDIAIPGVALGVPHDLQIVWKSDDTVEFYVDGSLAATQHRTFSDAMRVYAAGAQTLSVDSVVVSGMYPASGTYVSSVFDAGTTAGFQTLTSVGVTSAATTMSFATRTSPDGTTWSPWENVAADGTIVSPVGRYVQYRATLATTDLSTTPRLDEVSVAFDMATDNTPPAFTGSAPVNGATDVNPDAPITVDYDEVIVPATVMAGISGGAAVTTSFANANRRIVLTPTSGLSEHHTYTVTIAAGVSDLVGNTTTAPRTFSFTTGARLHDATDTTQADFLAGVHAGTVVTAVGDGAVALASSGVADSFDQADGAATNWQAWNGLVSTTPLPVWDVQSGVYVHELNSDPPSYHPAVLASSLTPSGDFTITSRQRITQVGTGSGDGPSLGFVWGATSDRDYWWMQYAPGAYGGLKVYRVTAPLNIRKVGENLSLPFPVLNQWYNLKLEVSGTTFKVYVDGLLQFTGSDATYVPARIGLLAYGGARQEYDDVTVAGNYTSPGTFLSRIADAGNGATWSTLSAVTTTPAGTSLAFETRTGDTVVPDGSWSGWSALGANGAVTSPAGRYLQYRASLATTNLAVTPVVEAVTLRYALVNHAPVASDDSAAVDEDGQLTVAAPGVLSNDSDVDNDALTAEVVSQPAHGVLALAADGGYTYAPSANWHGTDSFSYRANDGALASQTVTVTITINGVNDIPVAHADSATVAEDALLTVAAPGVLTNDTDLDGDALAAEVVAQPAHGTLQLDANGGYTYQPAASWHGTDTFTYRANDGNAYSQAVAVTITVTAVNHAPVAHEDTATIAEDGQLSVAAPGVLTNDSDADNDALTAEVVSQPAHGVLALAADGGYTYAPAANWHGTDSFTYRSSDGTASSQTVAVTITVTSVNDTPVASADSAAVAEDALLSVAAPGVLTNDTDVDGDALAAEVVTQPAHGTLQLAADGSYTYQPAANWHGTDTFTYRASDNTVTSQPATVTITVTAVNDTPVVTNPGAQSGTVGAAVIVALSATDADGDAVVFSAIGLPAGLTISSAGVVTGTPTTAAGSPFRVTVSADDGHGGVGTTTFDWTVTSATTTCPNGQWRASYYPNRTLSGSPVLTRCESAINNSWGSGAPAGVPVGADNFSVRWTQTTSFAGGYTFGATGDDGIRLFVDGVKRLSIWSDHAATMTTSAPMFLTGTHTITVEYYEHTGIATAKAGWTALNTTTSCPAGRWLAAYYPNRTLSGPAAVTRCESAINNSWGSAAPAGVPVGSDNFSVRWTQTAAFRSGRYTFHVTADDGIRVRVDGAIVLNDWADHSARTRTAGVVLTGGNHTVTVEYYEHTGTATAKAYWSAG